MILEIMWILSECKSLYERTWEKFLIEAGLHYKLLEWALLRPIVIDSKHPYSTFLQNLSVDHQ